MFVFGLLAQLLVYGALGFLSPTMSLHLMSLPGFDEFWVGIFFGVPVIIYIINTPLVSFYLKWSSRRTVIFLGMTIFCVACAMIGTSPLLGIPNSTQIIFLGLCCVGFASSMVVIPIFPEMLHSIE
jgi:MFS family permease